MTDSDYNAIRPVEGLQTIQGLTPIQRQQERKRRRDTQSGPHSEPETEPEATEEPKANPPNEDDGHVIDYCA
jgi:hypothetical protein